MANRITTIIDFVTTGAQNSVRGFRQSIADADGTVNKFKAGASSAMTTLQANAGNLALAGGAALVAFGTKAVTAFQDTAIAAGKFSDATGLAVEDASRLTEVAGDVGVEAASIESAIVRMNAAAAKGDLEKFGVELQRTADGTVDVNATFLETIRVLNGIKDPTERALAAQKIFGRGYKEVAEIIFDSADNVSRKLGEVSESKVIDEEELRKAREFRESMDNLKDALEDIQLAAGEALVPILSDLADMAVLANDARGALEDMIPGDDDLGFLQRGALPGFVDAVKDLKDAFDGGSDSGGTFRGVIQGMLPEINEAGNVVRELGDEMDDADVSTASLSRAVDRLAFPIRDVGAAVEDTTDAVNKFEDGLQKAGDQVNFLTSELNKLDEDLDAVKLLADIEKQFARITEGTEDQQGEVIRLIELVSEYVGTLDGLDTQKVTEIIAVLRRGNVDEIKALLADLTKDQFVNLTIQPKVGASVGGLFSPTQANPVFIPQQSAIPSGNTIINNYPIGTTTTSVYVDQQTDIRRNGVR